MAPARREAPSPGPSLRKGPRPGTAPSPGGGTEPRGRRGPLQPGPSRQAGKGVGEAGPGGLREDGELFVAGGLTSFLPPFPPPQGLNVDAGARRPGQRVILVLASLIAPRPSPPTGQRRPGSARE